MSEPPREFFTGTSLEQAVLTAAQHYGIEPDDLAYERVERRYGFLRQRRNVVIKVDPKRPARKRRAGGDPLLQPEPEIEEQPQLETQKDFNLHRDPPRAAPPSQPARRGQGQPRQPREHRQGGQRPPRSGGQGEQRPPRSGGQQGEPPAGRGEGAREARGEGRQGGPRRRRRRRRGGRGSEDGRPSAAPAIEFVPERPNLPVAEGELADLVADTTRSLVTLAGLELDVEVLQGEVELEVELSGPDQDLLYRDEGKLLLALQHLLPRSMQGAAGESVGVRVDSGGFRSQRVARLERLAREAAEDVLRRGRAKTLHSMNPADRRTVHMALKDAEGVTTESSGEGFFKRITVRPV